MTEDIDRERPTPNEDEVVCDICWKLMPKNGRGDWSFFKFNSVSDVIACRGCTIVNHGELRHKQAIGL